MKTRRAMRALERMLPRVLLLGSWVAYAGAISFAQVNTTAGSAQAPTRDAEAGYEDRLLAGQSGLPELEIRAIRSSLDIPADSRPMQRRIVAVDATSLKPYGHILVVESENNGCLALHVLERNQAGLAEVWSLDKLPVHFPKAGGTEGICRKAPRGPSAHGTQDGRIVVEVPVQTDPFQRTFSSETYTFVWDGHTYRQVD